MPLVHIIGAGLAGLSAGVELAKAGHQVQLWEQAVRAGGRCRSFHDAALDCVIDNGNHMLLSGNRSAMAYLQTIGAEDRLIGPDAARFPFLDVRNGNRWTIAPNSGKLPWWMFSRHRRAPGTSAFDYLAGLRLLNADATSTVSEVLKVDAAVMELYWEPLVVAVLNAPPDTAAAILLKPVLLEIFAQGAAASRPRIARHGLSDTFIDPALEYITDRGGNIRHGSRLLSLDRDGDRVTGLTFARETVALNPGDQVVLSVPPTVASDLLPGLTVPDAFAPIVNAHFRLDHPIMIQDDMPVIGIVGGTAQWIFLRDDVASVTVSAAEALADSPAETVAEAVWRDVAMALSMASAPLPRWRIIKERRATFAQTPAQIARRPGSRTAYANLVLAGDWTATGLPATIEGAIRSGATAAANVLSTNLGQLDKFAATIKSNSSHTDELASRVEGRR
ncbi:squalene-associated FAD-dependent desaturase [Rhodoligotrophos appendicifer]|uniref:hydroxysqualene dehydroxylase HpnE n=1 Tax=Rhodoligotrophos appendicifer TaxID=987056 RepID=UPI001184E3C0|nr:hydroxysqualene dehydroxylase HpnE [Rhodoligotrophos appendicifer]